MPVTPSEETNVILEWSLKIAGGLVTFLTGVVSATWVIASKFKGWEDRVTSIEEHQSRCTNVTLVAILQKIDDIPDKIEEKMEKKFDRVHDRIDSYMRENSGTEHES